MNIRFYHARIATMQNDCSILEGELWVTNNRISYVGAKRESQISWDREIDCKGNLLMPGFKNGHTHSAMTFLRSYADDLPLHDWLNKQIFPMEAKLTPDDIYHLSKLAILEYITSGMTANFDMYITPDTIVQASIDTGFRTVLCGGVSNFLHTVPQVENWYKKYNNYHELISFQLGFHAEYTIDRAILMDLAALAKQLKAPVYTHNSETKAEVDACMSRNQMTPTAFLDSLGIYDFGGGGYHCVHMTDEDLYIVKKKGVSVVTNPGSNTKLASGIARIKDMLSLGINIAIGTDGPASNNCLDMFREMFLVTGLSKLKNEDASSVDANEVLKMATVNGAKAMCLTECDCLAEGKLADLIMIDLHQPNMQPMNNITKNIVYSGSKTNVKLTMVNGKILYENGEFFVGEDPEAIYAKANEIINRMR